MLDVLSITLIRRIHMARKKNLRITTPAGTAVWPRLNEPDKKFNKDGTYSVNLRLPKTDAEGLIDDMNAVLKTHIENISKENPKKKIEPAALPIKDVVDGDNNPTGEVDIKFKLNAVGLNGADRWEQRPALFDSTGKPLTETIGSGSTIKVGAEIVPYYTNMAGAGITLRMRAVQVLELTEFQKGDNFDSWSFSSEKGFVSSGEKTVPEAAEESEHGFDF